MLYGPDRFLNAKVTKKPRGSDDDPLFSQKAMDAASRWLSSGDDASSELALQERQVLSREQALKASVPGGSARTTYTYATGPDGRRYIVGAEVSVIGPEEVLDAIPGGIRTGRSAGVEVSGRPGEVEDAAASGPNEADDSAEIAELEKIQNEVIAHEAAHQAAAGRFGGPAAYTYTTGPDGRRYITGGEVSISTPPTSDPEEAVKNAMQVVRAALAPGNPSGQDIAVAASATRIASSAKARIALGGAGGASEEAKPDIAPKGKKAAEAYSSQLSPRGLWTSSRGYGGDGSPPIQALDPEKFEAPSFDSGYGGDKGDKDEDETKGSMLDMAA
jgi:hypothetical protein